jgi:hypothetical protein
MYNAPQFAKSTIGPSDITTNKSNLYQLIDVISGDISGSDTRKKYEVFVTGGLSISSVTSSLFQTVFDQNYSFQTSNPILDLTVGVFSGSDTVASSSTGQDSSGKILFPSQSLMMREKINIYKQHAQILLGDPESYFVSPFGSTVTSNNVERIDEAVFLNVKRLFVRDGIRKETFAMRVYATGSTEANKTNILSASLNSSDEIILTDKASLSNRRISVCGEVGNLVYTSGATDVNAGLIFYDKGIVVLDAKRCFKSDQAISGAIDSVNPNAEAEFSSGKSVISASFIPDLFVSASVDDVVDHLAMSRFGNSDLTTAVAYQNKTSINSTLYFCRAAPGQFNYSTNPTYTDSDGKIRVVDDEDDMPFSYVTTIGLYNSAGELLAVAKTSRPIEKNPETDLTIRVRLDY